MRFSLARMRPILIGHTVDLDSTVLCHTASRREFEGVQSQEAWAQVASSLGGILAEGRRLLWASMRSGNSGSANGCAEFDQASGYGASPEASDWTVTGRCGIFRETILGEVLREPRVAYIIVARLTAVVRKLVIYRTVHGLAGGGTGDRGGRSGSQSAELESSEASLCLSASGDFGAARGQRETINRLSRIYVSGDGHQRTGMPPKWLAGCMRGEPTVKTALRN